MNKRKTSSETGHQMLPNSKHIKLTHNCAELLDGIDFLDFDDEFTSSEDTTDEQRPTKSDQLNGTNINSQETEVNRRDSLLDLCTWKRCIIDECHRDGRTKDLIIVGHEDKTKCDIAQKTDNDNRKIECRLQHVWSQCRIEVGDIVSIMAVWNEKIQSYCVNSTDGLVVVRPDFLVSGTTVVGGLFCMRKAVLQDRFKGIEAGVKIVCFLLQIKFLNKLIV